jgi:hypothetical protein
MDQMQDGEGGGQASSSATASDDRLAALYPNDQPHGDGADNKPRPEPRYPDDQPKTDGDQQEDQPELRDGEYRVLQESLPEGYEVDHTLLREATPVFRSLGLTNDQANRLVPLAAKVQERLIDSLNDEFAATKAEWAELAKKDPEIGGAKWKQTERLLGVALDAAGVGPKSEFTRLMNESGLGNHPAIIRGLRSIGEALTRKGTSSGRHKPDRTEILYPDD